VSGFKATWKHIKWLGNKLLYENTEFCFSTHDPGLLANVTYAHLWGPFEKFVDSPYYSGVGTWWRCGDGLLFEVPPLASDALLTTLRPFLENVLQTVCHKLQEDSGTGGFDLGAPFLWLEKSRNRMGRDLDCTVDVLMGFHRSRWAHPLPLFNRATLTLH
jgi:hypothetical protein